MLTQCCSLHLCDGGHNTPRTTRRETDLRAALCFAAESGDAVRDEARRRLVPRGASNVQRPFAMFRRDSQSMRFQAVTRLTRWHKVPLQSCPSQARGLSLPYKQMGASWEGGEASVTSSHQLSAQGRGKALPRNLRVEVPGRARAARPPKAVDNPWSVSGRTISPSPVTHLPPLTGHRPSPAPLRQASTPRY